MAIHESAPRSQRPAPIPERLEQDKDKLARQTEEDTIIDPEAIDPDADFQVYEPPTETY
ncbi:MAG TPA: hypothetical protein VLF88_02945 [Candidatus Babeliales bacterium]|nr:hypothetical protein [Candidatus Babeliales bacterium]